MKWLKKSILALLAGFVLMTRTVWASEDLKASSMMSEGDIYLKAFYAALITIMVLITLWVIIFRPGFKSSDDKF